jgi:hypothetical protein
MPVTMTAVDSPSHSATNKWPALILNAVILVEPTAWAGLSPWGVTLPPVIEANPGKRHRTP